jgi:predicted Zn-dependent protease
VKHRVLATVLAALLAGTSVTPSLADDTPPSGYQPSAASTEGGLWMQADEIEKNVQRSPLLVRDPALNAYVRGVVCKLAGARCASLRVYVVKIPLFNAYTLPNGAVVVWTGLLLRVENEAQLAMILGHEMTHYFDRHTFKNYESARDTSNALAFLGLGGLAALPIMLVAGSVLISYSRDQEREADAGGFDLATAAGYDPTQAGAIWKFMSDEEKADPNRPGTGLFGSDHPTSDERLATMTQRGADLASQKTNWFVGADAFHAATAPFRHEWLEDEMARGNAYQSVAMLARLTASNPSSGLVKYYLGEAYRRRNQAGDAKRAEDTYTEAIACNDAPAQAWRDLGLMAMKAGDKAAAKTDFDTYLSRAPEADDRAMIQFYLAGL